MAGGTKRMSADEKRKVILDLYHATKAVYTEKEIITLATKAGVNSNTIPDIHQSLIDDGLVEKEKIGNSNFFWSFPANKDAVLQVKHQETLKRIQLLQNQVQEATARLQDAKRGREEEVDEQEQESKEGGDEGMTSMDVEEDGIVKKANGDTDQPQDDTGAKVEALPTTKKQKQSTGRSYKLKRLQDIAAERKALEMELDSLKENDPQALADLQKELQLVIEAANRWTDNIFNCKSYLTKKRNMDCKDANKYLGINDEFDYPEDKIPK